MVLITDKICRTCMTTDSTSLCSIFEENPSDGKKFESTMKEPNFSLLSSLTNLMDLNIRKSDNLPKEICRKCIEELNQAFQFKEKSHKSERILQNYCSSGNPNILPNDNDVKPCIESMTNKFDGIEATQKDYLSDEDVQPQDIDHLTFFEMNLTVNDNSYLIFDCNKCGMRFSRQKNLEKHCEQYHQNNNIKTEMTTSNLMCKFCDRAFTRSRLLNRHVLKHLNGEIQYPKISLTTSATKAEEQMLSIKKESTDGLHTSISIENKVTPDQESFECDCCAKVFKKKRLLQKHMLRMHIKPKVVKPFKCTEGKCDQAFPNGEQLASHVIRKHQAHLKHTCQYCKKEFSAKTLRDHIRAQHLKVGKHLCNICGKTFLSNSEFKIHTARHIGSKDFICPICGRGFVLKGQLSAHVETHKKLHPYICDICGKAYTKPYSLTKHKRVHTGEKPFSCEYCPMKFVESKGLSSHHRTHTGERPYICSFEGKGIACEKRYSQQCHLVSHVRRNHTGEKPYSCDFCDKKFTESKGLKYHRRTHTGDRPYKCTFEDCGKAFIQSFELTLHNRVHTGERPHVCVDCGSAFMRTSTLSKHRKIHLKNKAVIEVTDNTIR